MIFVDPGVSDVETILDHLRPEVEAILLHAPRPVAQQICRRAQRSHGAPGRSASPAATSMLMF
jgi:hypothetical protein